MKKVCFPAELPHHNSEIFNSVYLTAVQELKNVPPKEGATMKITPGFFFI